MSKKERMSFIAEA